jgi:putative serine protease PepD
MSSLNRFIPVAGGAVAGGLVALVIAGNTATTHTVTNTVAGSAIPASISSGRGLTVNEISKNATPGVVDITVTSQSAAPGSFGGGGQTQGEGAGFVFDSSGHILTDEHVVAGASSVSVKFKDGHKYSAKVVGTDPSTDVGVIKVNAPASELHPLQLADSSAAQVGDPVVAIGSPFGLPGTVTTGIVSATGRSIQAPNQYTITGAIQTDAAINQGNSGGPLLDARGRVLGLNDQIETNSGSSAGVGFAVPSNTAARVAKQIIGGQTVKHSYLGVRLNAGSGGAAIAAVTPGSPGEGAGLQQGDVVTAINGKSIASTDQFIATIDTYAPGDTVTLKVNRSGSSKDIKVKLGTRPEGQSTTLG